MVDGTQAAFAGREVVLAAGVIGTPQLLLLSGLGPVDHLAELDIDVLAHLPGVGANLQDHPKAQVSYRAQHQVRPTAYARKPLVLTRTNPAGPLDLQMIFVEFALHPRFIPGSEDGYSILFSLMTPDSRGRVSLASADPSAPPLIDPHYLQEPSDMARMMAGLRLARTIGEAAALAPLRKDEAFPGRDANTDGQLGEYIRSIIDRREANFVRMHALAQLGERQPRDRGADDDVERLIVLHPRGVVDETRIGEQMLQLERHAEALENALRRGGDRGPFAV